MKKKIKAWAIIYGKEILFPLYKTKKEVEIVKKRDQSYKVVPIEIKILNPHYARH